MDERQIIHVDMDAFFASVEQRDNPELRGRPVLVGGASRRGVVAAASYEAREFGVRSAMPMVEALRRCPQAVVVGLSHAHYGEVSAEIFAIFRRFTPLVEGLSLDEAFLDVTASRALFGDAVTIAGEIKAAIREELQLTASAGVAPCKFAAKIASDLEKPDGLVVVPADVAGFLADLPIERMWGIGPVAATRVREAGIATIGDLAAASPGDLEALLGIWGRRVHGLANGLDDRDVVPGMAQKSIGAEHTFEHDLFTPEQLQRQLLAQAGRVARRLFAKGLYAGGLAVKVKFADFSVRSSRMMLSEPACDTDTLYAAACALLRRVNTGGRPVRLTGIAALHLTTGPIQRSLFAERDRSRHEAIEAVTAKIKERFGDGLVTRATLLEE